jgi:hypothetical protein
MTLKRKERLANVCVRRHGVRQLLMPSVLRTRWGLYEIMSNPTSSAGICHCAGVRIRGMLCDLREGAGLHKEIRTVGFKGGSQVNMKHSKSAIKIRKYMDLLFNVTLSIASTREVPSSNLGPDRRSSLTFCGLCKFHRVNF